MSQSDRAIKKFATQLARLDREVKSWRGAQADFTSIENGGNFTFKDSDGNVTAIMGGQDDGSNTIRHVDGPTPPIPSGLSAHVDGPIVQVSWDGTFEDADTATYDWSHLEVIVVGPSNEQLTATINDVTGASTSVAATASGVWTVAARSVSRAEKRSLDGDAGTVEVKLVDIDGAIEAVQDSANGKNKVTYSEHAPTPDDPGIFDDTWFVGQVGRPNDVVEATNLATNPTFVDLRTLDNARSMGVSEGASLAVDSGWSSSGSGSLRVSGTGRLGSGAYVLNQTNAPSAADAGKTFTMSCDVRLSAPLVSPGPNAGTIIVGYRNTSGAVASYAIAISDKAPNVAGVHRVSVTVTLPPDFGGWLVRCMADVASGSVWFDSFMWREGAADHPYFDGDTPSGATDNESHYRWTGTPHASTSEKFLPALTIGDSDSWNITEQYRHDGSGWVKVELSHKVFSSVDLGKATVGELDGIRIMGKTIHGEQLSGDAIDGKVITGANIRTSSSGARVQMDVGGLRVFDSSDNQVVQLPSDGTAATFNGELVAKSLTSTGRASFLAEDNRIEPGAGLVLAAGVGDPPSPPVVSAYYPTIPAPAIPDGYACAGLAYTGGYFYRLVDNLTGFENDLMQKISPDGNVVDEWEFLYTARNGMTAINDELFLLGYEEGKAGERKRHVRVYSTTGEYKRQWEYDKYGTGTYQPGIGRDDTGNVVIAQCWTTGELTWRTYNPNTGAMVSQVDTNDNTRSDINGIYVGVADFGVRRAVVSKAISSTRRQFPVLNTTTGAYVPEQSWFSPGRAVAIGPVWDGEKFYASASDGTISEFSTLNTGDDTADWWAGYRWAKDVDEDLTIDLSSRISPPARFSWPRRARLKVTAPNLPQGVGEIAPSLAYKTTTPSRTDFHSPNWWSVTGEPSAAYHELPPDWESYSTPADSNNFPDGEPSVLSAASGLFEVKGDGSGRWGPLTFNADGTMSSSQIPEWVPVTTFASGFEPRSWGFAPAYRVWPDGKVEWRGVVSGSIPPSAITPILTVPSVARPPQPVNLPVAVSGSTGTPLVTRVEFGGLSTPTTLTVMGNGDTLTWVALDGIHYYKD